MPGRVGWTKERKAQAMRDYRARRKLREGIIAMMETGVAATTEVVIDGRHFGPDPNGPITFRLNPDGTYRVTRSTRSTK